MANVLDATEAIAWSDLSSREYGAGPISAAPEPVADTSALEGVFQLFTKTVDTLGAVCKTPRNAACQSILDSVRFFSEKPTLTQKHPTFTTDKFAFKL